MSDHRKPIQAFLDLNRMVESEIAVVPEPMQKALDDVSYEIGWLEGRIEWLVQARDHLIGVLGEIERLAPAEIATLASDALEDTISRMGRAAVVPEQVPLEDQLRQANFFRDRLAERLEMVAFAVTELECALSFDPKFDPEHWRGHVESALDVCKRATRARVSGSGNPQT